MLGPAPFATLIQLFQEATGEIYLRLLPVAENLLFFFLVLSVAFACFRLWTSPNTQSVGDLLRLVVFSAVAIFFLRTAPYWFTLVVDSADAIGRQASTIDGLRPGALFDVGSRIAQAAQGSLLTRFGPLAGLMAPFSVIFYFSFLFPFAVIVLRVVLVQLQLALLAALLPLVGCAATPITWGLFAAFARVLTSLVFQFLMNYILLGIAYELFIRLESEMSAVPSLRVLSIIFFAPGAYAYLVWKAAPKIADTLAGSWTLPSPYRDSPA